TSASTTRFCSRPLAPMLAANAAMSASACGTFRTFFGDFFSLFNGTKNPLPVVGWVFLVMSGLLFRVYGFQRKLRAEPLPVGETGEASARGSHGRGGSPGLHKRSAEDRG